MTAEEDESLPTPPDISPTEDVSDKKKSKDGMTNDARTAEDDLLKQQPPAADSCKTPYAPFPPPGYYLKAPPGMEGGMNGSSQDHLMDPRIAPKQHSGMMANPTQPYVPPTSPFPPSPYISDRNDTRPKCVITPSPRKCLPPPRPLSYYEQATAFAYQSLSAPPSGMQAFPSFPDPHIMAKLDLFDKTLAGGVTGTTKCIVKETNNKVAAKATKQVVAKKPAAPKKKSSKVAKSQASKGVKSETSKVLKSKTSKVAKIEASTMKIKGESNQVKPRLILPRPAIHVKSKAPVPKAMSEQRQRKNSTSRARAATKKQRIAEIEAKPEHKRTKEEKELYDTFLQQKEKKNQRSRERALERKAEIERILSKPEKKRTKIEKSFLAIALAAKKRKNEGDRIRRLKKKKQAQGDLTRNVPPPDELISFYEEQHQRKQAEREWYAKHGKSL